VKRRFGGSTWGHFAEDGILHSQSRENLKSYIIIVIIIIIIIIIVFIIIIMQTVSGAQPASYPMGFEGFFPRGKAATHFHLV
jgi:heme/copper-type cytochrome/quinol oxidase subunit 2